MWIRLVPRQQPLINLPVEQMDVLVNLVWGDKTDIFKWGRREPFGAWFVKRIVYMVDQEEVSLLAFHFLQFSQDVARSNVKFGS